MPRAASRRPGRKLHNADLARELLLAPVVQSRQPLRGGVEDFGFPIRPYGLVRQPLRLQGLFPGDVRVYYQDPYLREFPATVLSCESAGETWKVVLDQTAFYPEGGGQPAGRW